MPAAIPRLASSSGKVVPAEVGEGLVLEDGAPDEGAEIGRGDQELSVGGPGLGRRLDAELLEPTPDRARGLVDGEDPAPVGQQV